MKDIIQIIIESSSGFGPVQDAFTDKLILTEDSISYEYNPEIETRFNPKIKWSYARDNSSEYHKRANFPENIEFSGISLYSDKSIRHHKNTRNFNGN